MSDNQIPTRPPGDVTRDELLSGLFASLVLQQTNMALMMLGKVPPQEGAEPFQDLDSARVFIDQLEMLEVKTRGNLSKDEAKLLKQNLTALRMAFVETVESHGGKQAEAKSSPQADGHATGVGTPSATEQPGSQPASATTSDPSAETGGATEESRKKFSKKY